MNVSVVLALETGAMRSIPLARTRRPEVLRVVAEAALADVLEAAAAEPDGVLCELLLQEAERMAQGFTAVGLEVMPCR